MDDLLRADAQDWQPVAAPAGAIPEVRLDVTRALDLGLIPEAPVRPAALVADLRALVPAAPEAGA